jgi:hypothetical protein
MFDLAALAALAFAAVVDDAVFVLLEAEQEEEIRIETNKAIRPKTRGKLIANCMQMSQRFAISD